MSPGNVPTVEGGQPAGWLWLEADRLRLLLAPEVGGSIARFDSIMEGTTIPILRSAAACLSSPLDAACFPLVPFSNRIRDGRFMVDGLVVTLSPNMAGDPNPLHGQGWLDAWQVESSSDTAASLLFRHPAGEWPWAYEAQQHFALDPSGLSVRISCRNLDEKRMPCGLGFHPYFPCMPKTRLRTRVEHVWTIDEHVLPVERVPATGRYDLSGGTICGRALDNGYDGWGGRTFIETPASPFSLELSSPDAGYFQIYSPPEGGVFVAEPVSHANNVLSLPEEQWATFGMRLLEPGEEMAVQMRLDVVPA